MRAQGPVAPLAAPLWQPLDESFTGDSSLEGRKRLQAATPNSGSTRLRLLGAALGADNRQTVREMVASIAAMGAVVPDSARSVVAPYFSPGEWERLQAQMVASQLPVAASSLYAIVPAEHEIIEGIAFDAGGRPIVSSVVSRGLLRFVDGAWTAMPVADDLASPLAMAYDSKRGMLWVPSAIVDPTPHPAGAFIGLIGIDPSSGERRHYPAPEGARAPGDVAVGPDGTAYVSDSSGAMIYRLRPGDDALQPFVPQGYFRSPQGMAISADGRLLYVSDYYYGLAAIDLATGTVHRVTADSTIMLDGIDAMLRDGDTLYVIRNSQPPMQIAALTLSADGLSVTHLRVIERNHPEWGEITTFARRGDRLYYIADAQWERYSTPEGDDRPTAKPTPIRVVSPR